MVFYYFCVDFNLKNRKLVVCHGSLYGAFFLKDNVLNEKIISNFKNKFVINKEQGLYLKYYIRGNPDTCMIDYHWNFLIFNYLVKNLYLEKTMWNLSTFGGAYSSMGDYLNNFAETAGKLSIAQYLIAKQMNDETLMARCKLFFCLSLAQRKHVKLAYHIIKEEYKKAKVSNNEFIIDCARGTLAKIKSLLIIKKKINLKCC
uniref:Glycosyltransferase n=1 Tax=Parastrongyloides trichosuri TaxID=131310 RepID=A0A0N5A267_PARTI